MSSSFIGNFNQRVDSKGRMSIPADFRRVLEAGDPRYPENPNPRLVLLYGPHLKNCLHIYTIEAMAEIEADIKKLDRGSIERRRASQLILAKAWSTEVDKDGRIVLPKDRRLQIELDAKGGDVVMQGMGDFFELWRSETHEVVEDAELEAYLDEQGEGFDPLSLLGGG